MLSKEMILNILQEKALFQQMEYKVKRIGLFGSVARGDSTLESDIDIMVEFFDKDDTTIVCGCLDLEDKLKPIVGSKLHLSYYPLADSNCDPPELIWVCLD